MQVLLQLEHYGISREILHFYHLHKSITDFFHNEIRDKTLKYHDIYHLGFYH